MNIADLIRSEALRLADMRTPELLADLMIMSDVADKVQRNKCSWQDAARKVAHLCSTFPKARHYMISDQHPRIYLSCDAPHSLKTKFRYCKPCMTCKFCVAMFNFSTRCV